MSFDNHQIITDAEGNPMAFIVPKVEYEMMQDALRRYHDLYVFEESFHRSLKEAMEMKKGAKPMPSFQTLMDAL